MFDKLKQDWDDMDIKFKGILGAIALAGVAFIFIQSKKNQELEAKKNGEPAAAAAAAPREVPPGSQAAAANQATKPYNFRAIPDSNRNQGLEDLKAVVEQLRSEILIKTRDDKARASAPQKIDLDAPVPDTANVANSPNKGLPPPVKFDPQIGSPSEPIQGSVSQGGASAGPTQPLDTPSPIPTPEPPPRPKMKIWTSSPVTAKDPSPEKKFVLPVNSALESIMLSGINARPTGSVGGAAGSALSANDVGAPFVTRIKGDAILPNGWKLSDLGECFLGGSAIAVISAERAYAISNTISCIGKDGEIFEAPIKAYGLDVDGIQGLSGKIVSKQGSILMQALLTGIASGLGTALVPQQIPSFNNAATGSSPGVQYPDPNVVAATALGTGISNASTQLSRFYLEYAREVFPVIEIPASTRVTWILKETTEFKRVKKG